MKVLVFVLSIAASALGFPGPPPMKVRGTREGNLLFDCDLKNNVSEEAYGFNRRIDDRCKDFPSALDTLTNVNLSVKVNAKGHFASLKEFATQYGSKIKSLKINSWRDDKPTFQEMFDIFIVLPKIEHLTIEGLRDSFPIEGEGTFNVTHLKTLTFADNHFDLLDLFAKHLPKDILNEFVVDIDSKNYSPEIMKNFIDSQKHIQKLDIKGYSPTENPMKLLKLQKFSYNSGRVVESDAQKAFLREFLKAQPQLVELSILGPDFYYKYLDDSLFAEICKLEHLAVFKFNIDGISSEATKDLKNLKSLKALTVKTNLKESEEKFIEMSKVALSGLETLYLAIWGDNLPEKFYEQVAENFNNLKTLYIGLGNTNSLNFFMKTFPDLEHLKITFGESNNQVTFEKSYEDDGHKHEKLKKLELEFADKQAINTELFFKMRNSFPNIEHFVFSSKFPFTAEFLTTLHESLGKIDHLRLSFFEIPCNEDFDDKKIQIIKKFNNKLDSVHFHLENIVSFTDGGNTCAFYENGKVERKKIEGTNTFSFNPLSEALKHDFYLNYDSYSTIENFQNLQIIGGKRVDTVDPYDFRALE